MKTTTQTIKTKQQMFQDMATSLQFGNVNNDRRIQVKMPQVVVDELDALFPHIDRSHLLTKLAVDAIIHQLKFIDRPDLGAITQADQAGLDTMLDYLETRDAITKN